MRPRILSGLLILLLETKINIMSRKWAICKNSVQGCNIAAWYNPTTRARWHKDTLSTIVQGSGDENLVEN
jgi:hypothetical protein